LHPQSYLSYSHRMLATFATVVVVLIAVIHVWILVLEMFLWTTRYGRRAFGNSVELAQTTAVLAANQGLYNGMLAAGLFWGAWLGHTAEGQHVKIFCASCVLVAGLYGALSTKKKSILAIQAAPAAVALALLLAA
jgi:putative membrane protein